MTSTSDWDADAAFVWIKDHWGASDLHWWLDGPEDLKRLKTLDLHDTGGVDDAGMLHLRGLEALESLDLGLNRGLTGQALRNLSGGVPALRRLILVDAEITDDDLEHAAGLPALEELVLDSIKGPGLRHLAGSRIKRLTLQFSSLEDLSSLALLSGLEKLILDYSTFDEDELEHVGGLTDLRELWVQQTPVGDRGLEHLLELHKLQDLVLHRARVTLAGVQRLEAALPRLKVHADANLP